VVLARLGRGGGENDACPETEAGSDAFGLSRLLPEIPDSRFSVLVSQSYHGKKVPFQLDGRSVVISMKS
jgi:hypothetical protein